jgi:hypothetical protein
LEQKPICEKTHPYSHEKAIPSPNSAPTIAKKGPSLEKIARIRYGVSNEAVSFRGHDPVEDTERQETGKHVFFLGRVSGDTIR